MPKAIRQIRMDGNIAYVPLTQGYEAVIDVADVPLVEGWNWYAQVRPHTIYAKRIDGAGQSRFTVHLHRVVMESPDELEVDHRDGNGLNNRRGNLRLATRSQNNQNRNTGVNNTSGYKGVTWHKAKGKWNARIKINGKRRNLGYFSNPESAAAAYAAASSELHGEFGRTA